MRSYLGELQEAIELASEELAKKQIVSRIWEGDHTVWKPDPSEITNRLGWLHSPHRMQENLGEIQLFVDKVREEGFTHALLLGMGGSSLAPEVFRKTFGVREGFLDLSILDSTDPETVRATAASLDPSTTLYIVATKSGRTVETLSFFKHFYNLVSEAIGSEEVGDHFIAITDPGSKLQETADRLGFREVFLNDPNIGGRYSALSYFGLIPAGLIGMDLSVLIERGTSMANTCRQDRPGAENPAVRLGIILGEMAKRGKDKVTFILPNELAPFADWVEQLIAESTGKEGKGILPIVGESVADPECYRGDRLFLEFTLGGNVSLGEKLERLSAAGHPIVQLSLQDRSDLGAQVFLWEFATAIAGHQLGINPFDQPNVEAAKVLAREMMKSYEETGELTSEESSLNLPGLEVFYRTPGSTKGSISTFTDIVEALNRFFERVGDGGYVAIHAYVQPSQEMDRWLEDLREQIRIRTQLATTVGYGPRFLHSTGQLHKGDAGKGLFLQINSDTGRDLPIPDEVGSGESSMGFGLLKLAQAIGDREALLAAGRHVICFHVQEPTIANLQPLIEALED
jgi:glucose-6-phosphate isomerase